MVIFNLFLFLGGIGFSELIISFIIISVAGFFLWRMLLKLLLKKGQTGINVAAIIMGSIQTPLVLAILGLAIYMGIATQEAMDQMQAYDNHMDSVTAEMTIPDTTAAVDVLQASPDKCKLLLENEHVRVIQYSLKPGESDNPHTHPPKSYYVVSGGKLRVYPENGEPFEAEEIQGTSEWSGYVGKHYVENIGKSTVTLVLTEVKMAQYY